MIFRGLFITTIKSGKFLIFLPFIILFFYPSETAAQEQVIKLPVILLSTRTVDDTESASFIEIINNTIAIELNVDGFTTIIEEPGITEELFESAGRNGASFLIESIYSTENDTLSTEINCYRTIDRVMFYSVEVKVDMNLNLDAPIERTVEDIITQIKSEIEEYPELIIFEEPEEEPDEEPEETEETEETEERVEEPEIEPEEETVAESADETTPSDQDFHHYAITAGFSPFLTTGKASNYFTLGLAPEIHGEYRMRTAFGYLGFGLFSSLNYFEADGQEYTSENMLISAGPEFRVGLIVNRRLNLYFKVNGGLTVFMLNRDNEGYQSTLITTASAGLGLMADIYDWMGFVISTNYWLYFEESFIITGFSPTLGVYFSL